MKYFYYEGSHGKYPVCLTDEDDLILLDRKTGESRPNLLEACFRRFEQSGNARKAFQLCCREAPVNSKEELLSWLDQYDELENALKKAETACAPYLAAVREAKKALMKFPFPPKSYAETKRNGATDIIIWDDTQLTNPKTRNEFFSHEDAIETFEDLKCELTGLLIASQKQGICNDDEFNSAYMIEYGEEFEFSHYIWKDAACLDDYIMEEDKGEW